MAVGEVEGERAHERDRARERATERDAKWRGLARGGCTGRRWSQVAKDGERWPEGVVAVGAAERERELQRLARGGRRVRNFQTLNKPYGFGC